MNDFGVMHDNPAPERHGAVRGRVDLVDERCRLLSDGGEKLSIKHTNESVSFLKTPPEHQMDERFVVQCE